MTQPEHQHAPAAARTAESLGRVHFIGIGGVGMSAVARIMVARGLPVSGSDAKDLPVMADLAAAGARICVGYDAANLGDAQSVVAGSAIRPDNPELAAARAAGLPVLHRSEALAAAMAQDTAVTVAGTHGKSTTTSMITVLLQGAGPGPVLRHRRERPGAGRQRRQRQHADLRRGSRRIRRVLPELPPADRRRDQRRTGPPRLLRHRRGRLRLLRPLHRPAPGRRRAGCLRGRRRSQGPGPADPRARQHPRRALRHRR